MKHVCTLLLLSILSMACSCTASHAPAPKKQTEQKAVSLQPAAETAKSSEQNNEQLTDKTWTALHARLINDGFTEQELHKFFLQLEHAYSQKPMGNKVKELYNANFVPRKKSVSKKQKPKTNALGIPYPWYNGYVTKENALKCQNFIKAHEQYFLLAEQRYRVPRHVLSALIYVETWHGKFLGKFNPLPMLASMAVSTDLSMLPAYTENLHLTPKQKKWMQNKIKVKADWAYAELKALLQYALQNDADINSVPSSIYGAIGYGQFMPSNISRFGVDGNGDGKIDLFNPQDAILSVACFLNKQGWKELSPPFAKQVKVLKRYNYSTAYAHTILALAKLSKTVLPNIAQNKENMHGTR